MKYLILFYPRSLIPVFIPHRAGVPFTEQNHLHGQWREFRILINAQKTKENDVKIILSSLTYITPIRLPLCMSAGDTEREREGENFCKIKNKNWLETILQSSK